VFWRSMLRHWKARKAHVVKPGSAEVSIERTDSGFISRVQYASYKHQNYRKTSVVTVKDEREKKSACVHRQRCISKHSQIPMFYAAVTNRKAAVVTTANTSLHHRYYSHCLVREVN